MLDCETIMHSALNKWRINPRHEIFNLSSQEAYSVYIEVKEYIKRLIELCGKQMPIERPINYDYWKLAKEAAKKGKRKITQRKLVQTMKKRENH